MTIFLIIVVIFLQIHIIIKMDKNPDRNEKVMGIVDKIWRKKC